MWYNFYNGFYKTKIGTRDKTITCILGKYTCIVVILSIQCGHVLSCDSNECVSAWPRQVLAFQFRIYYIKILLKTSCVVFKNNESISRNPIRNSHAMVQLSHTIEMIKTRQPKFQQIIQEKIDRMFFLSSLNRI